MTDQQRMKRYERMRDQIAELIAKTDDPVAHRATAASILHHKVPGVSWTGFYMLKGEDLVVDAYQGPVACLVLERHSGVCWAGIDREDTVLVADVHAFPGHIACASSTRSELVLPVRNGQGDLIAVFDIDSDQPDAFTTDDADRLTAILADVFERA